MESQSLVAFDLLILAWFAYLGGAVGSFSNVVACRLPMGESIIWPGSRCPRCLTPIRWHDNVPILGWFLIRGRCRACQTPVPARYVWVEILFAGMFDVFYWTDIRMSGGRIPLEFLIHPSVSALTLFTQHVLLMSSLMIMALIRADRLPVPTSFITSVAFGLIVLRLATGVGWASFIDTTLGFVSGLLAILAVDALLERTPFARWSRWEVGRADLSGLFLVGIALGTRILLLVIFLMLIMAVTLTLIQKQRYLAWGLAFITFVSIILSVT
ncbi:prepilin peptidase [bacterium]|nr:prepilin peptidase [bacterium]